MYSATVWMESAKGDRYEHTFFGRSPKRVLSQAAKWFRSKAKGMWDVAWASDNYGVVFKKRNVEQGHLRVSRWCISHWGLNCMNKAFDEIAWITGCRSRLHSPEFDGQQY